MNIPSLAGCLNKIAGTVAAVPIKLYKREDDRITEVTDDRRTILLNSETGDTLDAYQMKRAVVLDYFLGRGGYIYIDKVRNEVRSLRYVAEKNISFNQNPDVIFKDYDILVQGNTYRPYQFVCLLRNTEDSEGYTNSELERMTEECLCVNPYIEGITDFECVKKDEKIMLSFKLITTLGEQEAEIYV